MERDAEHDLLPGGREMPPQVMLGAPLNIVATGLAQEVGHDMEDLDMLLVVPLQLQ